MTEKCLVCGADEEWTRHTQFAGDHPYCEHHAKKEDDFGEDDSYTFWSSKKEREAKIKNIIAGEAIVEDFGGYEEGNQEDHDAFVEKRNYPMTRYWTIVFPGEYGQHVQETWNKEQILKFYWHHWNRKMFQAGLGYEVTEDRCIEDWIVSHWAEETDQFGNKL